MAIKDRCVVRAVLNTVVTRIGFNPQAAPFWEWVGADSKSTCGIALRHKRRVVAPKHSYFRLNGGVRRSADLSSDGILSCQTTPLIASSGDVSEMISTHWRTPHQPSEHDFRLFDIVARGAANVIERCKRTPTT